MISSSSSSLGIVQTRTTTTRFVSPFFFFLYCYFIIATTLPPNQQVSAFCPTQESRRQRPTSTTTFKHVPSFTNHPNHPLSFHHRSGGVRSVDTTITTPTTKLQAMSSFSSLATAAITLPTTTTMTTHSSFWLVRILFLRGLALVYGVAFLVAYHQNKPLIGDDGITPARNVLNQAQLKAQNTRQRRQEWLEKMSSISRSKRQKINPFRWIGNWINHQPWYQTLREVLWDRSDRLNRPLTTILWLAPDRNHNLNPWLDGIAVTGIILAVCMFVLGAANVPLLFGLWTCQRSLMAVGGPWYGYGWEPQLAELGFHALFLVPLLSLNPFFSGSGGGAVPLIPIWAMRWFLFRIMMGAGLIKLKGDKKWKDLSAMDYFYETQPVPNPLSKYFHGMPNLWHKFEVLTNHMVELPAPFLLILPGLPLQWRRAGGLIQMVFQTVLISSGNLSFLNWLTALPAIFCLDDAFVAKFFSEATQTAASLATATAATATTGSGIASITIRQVVNIVFALLIGKLSIPVIRNLCAKRQIMNTSFDPLRLVNTYGAFGSVNDVRTEFIISSAATPDGPWKEYEFKVKPGNVRRRPRWISPYHYRLDWQMWIANAVGDINRSPWIYNFLLKLLEQDEGVLKLLANDPWKQSGTPTRTSSVVKENTTSDDDDNGNDDDFTQNDEPKYIRIEKYKYNYHKKKAGEKEHLYWDREFVSKVFPPVSADDLKDILKIL